MAPVGERIVSIKSVGVREVWDCTIEDDHSYVANGMISHNSLPRDGLVKRLYISRFKKGWILQRDYSGLEVRILALFSREPALLEAFRNGKDPHLRTQEYFFKEQADKSNKTQRSVCKRCLFGRIYGQGDDGLMELLRKERVPSPTTGEPITKEECHEFNQQIDELYPQVPTWVRLAHRQAIKFHWTCSAFGFTVPLQPMVNHAKVYGTPGNPRRYSDLTKQEEEIRGQVAAALRHAQNYGIQGTASDITSFAAWQIRQRFRKAKLKALLILVVHDAIYVDCPDEEVLEASMIMHDVMDNVPKWIGTMLPDYDPSWIDIPIIGEQETGINAKDALAAIKEPTEIGESFSDMILKVPKYDEDDARCDQVTRVFGHAKEITFLDNKALIRDYLASQRLVFR